MRARTMAGKTIGVQVSVIAVALTFGFAPAGADTPPADEVQRGVVTQNDELVGYSPEHAEEQLDYESEFSERVDSQRIGEFSRKLSSQPQLVGTEGARRAAEVSVDKLREAGLKVRTHDYQVYASVPRNIEVTMTAPHTRSLAVKERGYPWLGNFEDVVDGYNAYSPAGNVEGEVVYANYGRPEDFAALDRLGVDVRGKIVLVRYGQNFRGVKSKQAEERGARGVLIYSDPADDGFTKGPVYPHGPHRPADAIQRGSIQYMWKYPGDPLTPGEPSIEGTPRIDQSEAENLPRVPTTPISYGEAEPLLRSLGGPVAPDEFQGGLDFDYRVGPGETRVDLNLDIDYQQVEVRDVVAEIPGRSKPDEMVLLGGHYDAWTYGNQDNTSAWSTSVEIGRVLSNMAEHGWRPERTIVITGWDGEEYGLLGSTEYVEQYEERLGRDAVAYLNMDGVGGDEFGAATVPALDGLLTDVTKRVPAPRGEGSVFDGWRGGDPQPEIDRPGSGSDYTAFLEHVGVPVVDLGFSTEGSGEYHSAYDDRVQMEKFLDPGYRSHAAAAKLTGRSALRLANADVVPMRYSAYGGQVDTYVRELQHQQAQTPGSSKIDLDPVARAAVRWKKATGDLERRADELVANGDLDDPGTRKRLRKINHTIRGQERALLTEEGLPQRPWYRHRDLLLRSLAQATREAAQR